MTSVTDEDRTPTCLQCGYSLIGLISGVCPECGATVDATDILLLSDSTMDQRTKELQDVACAWSIGAAILMMTYLNNTYFFGALLALFPFGVCVYKTASVAHWRLHTHAMHLVASARLVDRKHFNRWLLRACFFSVSASIASVLSIGDIIFSW